MGPIRRQSETGQGLLKAARRTMVRCNLLTAPLDFRPRAHGENQVSGSAAHQIQAIITLKTALRIDIPPTLLAVADDGSVAKNRACCPPFFGGTTMNGNVDAGKPVYGRRYCPGSASDPTDRRRDWICWIESPPPKACEKRGAIDARIPCAKGKTARPPLGILPGF
jgi:hypothetical protein